LVSCDSKKEKPDPFLDHDQMVDILTDLSLAEGTRIYAVTSDLKRKDGEYSINDYYAMVFEKYNITQAQLDSINAWYINYPAENQAIFKEVLDRLNKLQAEEIAITKKVEKKRIEEMKRKKRAAKALADSIKNDTIKIIKPIEKLKLQEAKK
jgi:hypothetical protein